MVILNCFIVVYQNWSISNVRKILPDLVPFLIRVNNFKEIKQMWVISNCFMEINQMLVISNCFIDVYQNWLISNLITILPDWFLSSLG